MRLQMVLLICIASGLVRSAASRCCGAEPAAGQPGWFDPRTYRDLAQEQLSAWKTPEIAEMLTSILSKGSRMGPGDGWFHEGKSRYTWRWLADRYDVNRDGRITRKEFTGPAELFDRLDRTRDGVLTAADFDLSGRSFATMQLMIPGFWFAMHDRDSNGRISRAEWDALFDRVSEGKGYLTADDLRDAFPLSPPPPPPDAKPQKYEGPSPATLLVGLLRGELGSFLEGPDLGQRAPDFTLKTPDGKRTVTLSQFRGKTPVVLVFGSFT